MGSSVITGKKIAAFRAESGEIGYVVFAESYEKNCYPHTPRWSCRVIGGLEEVVQFIFHSASNCEGGMIQGRNGRITPEGYIQGWLKELAHPSAMQDVSNVLSFGDSYLSTLPRSQEADIAARLTDHGFGEVLQAIQAGGYEASLHKDYALLRLLFGTIQLGPWRFLDSLPSLGICADNLGYAPKKVAAPGLEIPKFFRVDKEELLVGQADGSYLSGGWAYRIVGSYIANYWRRELQYPGSYKAAIKEYREAAQAAPEVPLDALIQVSPDGAESRYDHDRLKAFAELMNAAGDRFSVTLAEVMARVTEDAHAVYRAAKLGNLAKWFIGSPATQPHQPSLALF